MSPPSTDFPSPVQGLVAQSYDQSTTGPQRRRKQLARERRFAAYARLVMAVAERRRLSEAEVRDLMRAQPDDPAAFRLMRDLDAAGLVGPTGMDGFRLNDGSPCDHCGEAFVHEDGCPLAEVDGQPVGDYRRLDLPLAANADGRDAP